MGKERVVFGIYNADGSFLGELQVLDLESCW